MSYQLSDMWLVAAYAKKVVKEKKKKENGAKLERLKTLKLPSLHYRRIRGDLIQAYKIFHNIDDIEVHKFFQFCDNSPRGHNFKINKQSYKILLKATRELLQQQSLRVVEQAHR